MQTQHQGPDVLFYQMRTFTRVRKACGGDAPFGKDDVWHDFLFAETTVIQSAFPIGDKDGGGDGLAVTVFTVVL
jgi:hypothetical protein